MKKIIYPILLLVISFSFSLHAQKVYYVYLQTENQQPFFARMGDRIYNSSVGGYLILSNLRDSTYQIKIGLQDEQSNDLGYSLIVNRKDQGYLIKNFGEKGWGLFNLTSMSVLMPETRANKNIKTVKTEKVEDNPFTDLLAKAADDSTIKHRPIISDEPVTKKADSLIAVTKNEVKPEKNNAIEIKEEKKTMPPPVEKSENNKTESPVISIQNLDTATKYDIIEEKKEQDENVTERKNIVKEIKGDVPYKKSEVKLKSESSTTAGIGLVFLDYISNDKIDTITIQIPSQDLKVEPIKPAQEERKFLDILPVDSIQKEVINSKVKNNNCSQVADEDDFYKLRKKMAGERNDDDMISEARKVFKTKCFTTEQIKNLSNLFLTEEYKYKFFDESYQYTSDPEKFESLQSELKTEYYINRFKVMLR